jgi:hypothetical protein
VEARSYPSGGTRGEGGRTLDGAPPVGYWLGYELVAEPILQLVAETATETCWQGHLTGQAALFDRGDDDLHLGCRRRVAPQFLVASVREARRRQHQSTTSRSSAVSSVERAGTASATG